MPIFRKENGTVRRLKIRKLINDLIKSSNIHE